MASVESLQSTEDQRPNGPGDEAMSSLPEKTPAAPSASAMTSTEKKARTKWGLPSVPILKILQGVFLILMIGQSLPGAEKSFWPFNKSTNNVPGDMESKPLTPFYVEMRTDLYGHERQFPKPEETEGVGLLRLLFGSKPAAPTIPVNTGIPAQEHIVMTHLNREYESYRYSIRSVTDSKFQAGHEFAQVSFRRALEKVLSRLTDAQDRLRLTILEERFLEEADRLVVRHAALRALLVDTESAAVDSLSQCYNSTETRVLFPVEHSESKTTQCTSDFENSTTNDDGSPRNKQQRSALHNITLTEIETSQKGLSGMIATFVTQINKSLPPGPAHAITDALMGHLSSYGTTSLVTDLQKSPMRTLFSNTRTRKRLFVTYFVGDVFASSVSVLRKEVTAILHSAETKDEVLVILQSSGGTVTGYGLVAAQLLRIKEAGLRLTVAVEQVAASGGYLAACVAQTIVCSPFALVGSIGVVREELNLYERLKREGIESHLITAGDYKRILSPLKEVMPEDLKKAKDELEEVYTLFKKFISDHRPTLDMDVVATGEIWFGTKAVELGLCDAIRSADDVLTDFVNRGYDVYEVKSKEPLPELLSKFLGLGTSASMRGKDGAGVIDWLVQKIVQRLKGELGMSGAVLMV